MEIANVPARRPLAGRHHSLIGSSKPLSRSVRIGLLQHRLQQDVPQTPEDVIGGPLVAGWDASRPIRVMATADQRPGASLVDTLSARSGPRAVLLPLAGASNLNVRRVCQALVMDLTLQLTIDCADPQRLVTFWSEALGYIPEPPPDGHSTWREYWAAMGVPEEELPVGAGDIPESIVDPAGRGPRVWFQVVPEPKSTKNRIHFDLKVGGGRDVPLAVRMQRVTATVERLVKIGASVLRITDEPDMGHYAVLLQDPEGNEFDVV